MDLDPATQEKISSLIGAERVVLFMKGERDAPRCGFSATVVQILDRLIPDYATVDVLEDPGVREGIKAYSSWPTVPQLYVGGEFVGGCDIIKESFESGDLARTLGVEASAATAPRVTITDAAAAALAGLNDDPDESTLHLLIDARFRTGLYRGPAEPGELRAEANGIALFMDAFTAARAVGLTLDAEQTADGPAFRIDNPNAPGGAAGP